MAAYDKVAGKLASVTIQWVVNYSMGPGQDLENYFVDITLATKVVPR